MVGSCMAMSVRKSPYTYQSNPMARMSMQARHHSGGSSWNTRSKNPFSYMVGKEFFKNENFDGDFFEDSHEELPYSVTQVELSTSSTLISKSATELRELREAPLPRGGDGVHL